MSDSAGIAASALNANALRQSVTASNISKLNTTNSAASSVVMQSVKNLGVTASVLNSSDPVDISKEATDMISTTSAFKANLKVLSTSDQMTRELLNIKA